MHCRHLRIAGLSFAISATLLLGACHKKTVGVVTPPPPAPAKPTATLTAAPANVQRGESVQLNWSTQNATEVKISSVGAVASSGTQTATPNESTTYTLTAKGAGGSTETTARVTVTVPPPAPIAQAGPTDQELFGRNIKDIYFDYDRYDVRATDAASLKADADFLSAHPGFHFVISGHCDERGSEDYNIALGSSRADGVRNELIKMGIAPARIKTISYGKEKPFCSEEKEECWRQNRRAHFSIEQ